MQTVPDLYKDNKIIAIGIASFYAYAFFILPVMLLPLTLWWALSLVPFIWMHITHWGLIHEAIHKHLATDSKENETGGRQLSILMGVSFHVVRFGHLMHHKLNRDWQSEMVEKKSLANKVYYYFHLLGGLYLAEVFTCYAMTLLSRKRFLKLVSLGHLTGHEEVYVAGERVFYVKENVKYVRQDTFLFTALHVAAFVAYGIYYPILIAFLVSRAVVISFMDNIYHYGTEKEAAGKDLQLPKWAEAMLLNSNYHNTHHKNPSVPWKKLPEQHAAANIPFEGSLLKHGVYQFKGPILKQAI